MTLLCYRLTSFSNGTIDLLIELEELSFLYHIDFTTNFKQLNQEMQLEQSATNVPDSIVLPGSEIMHMLSDVSAVVEEAMPKSRKEVQSHYPTARNQFRKGLWFDEKMHFLLELFRPVDFLLTKN